MRKSDVHPQIVDAKLNTPPASLMPEPIGVFTKSLAVSPRKMKNTTATGIHA